MTTNEKKEFHGKVAFVTGAAHSIGSFVVGHALIADGGQTA